MRPFFQNFVLDEIWGLVQQTSLLNMNNTLLGCDEEEGFSIFVAHAGRPGFKITPRVKVVACEVVDRLFQAFEGRDSSCTSGDTKRAFADILILLVFRSL